MMDFISIQQYVKISVNLNSCNFKIMVEVNESIIKKKTLKGTILLLLFILQYILLIIL